jgi:hypothetical protein
MPNDLIEVENDLNSVLQGKRRVQEFIDTIQQHINNDETWLSLNHPGTGDYQETLEELLALQAYVAELCAQIESFDEVVLELMFEREHWRNPDLVIAS